MGAEPSLDRADEEATRPAPDRLDRLLRDHGVAAAHRELSTALDAADGLTPAQRRTVARMAGRIAAGVLAPARAAVDGGGGSRSVDPAAAAALDRLFGEPELVRDGT